jgi:hypothetical protein
MSTSTSTSCRQSRQDNHGRSKHDNRNHHQHNHFFTDVLTADATWQSTPVMPGTTATLKPRLLWKSPFAASSHNSSNIHQLQNTDILLASSGSLNVLKFYRKLVKAD